MLMTLVALSALIPQGQDPQQDNPFAGVPIRQDRLTNADGTEANLVVAQPQGPLPTPKVAPKDFGVNKIKFDFDWITWGYGYLPSNPQNLQLRFRTYSQDRSLDNDRAISVTRNLLRLWDLNMRRLEIDHPAKSYEKIVNVYLTYGGKAGGEQFMSADIMNNRRVTVSNIFIYDIPSFDTPIEMAREVAHEYGHATLPAVGGYTAPEDWANGYLGEKLFLSWLHDLAAAHQLGPDDMMGATEEDLSAWLKTNVEPLVTRSATTLPSMGSLAKRDAVGMDNYLGLTTYLGLILPNKVFSRSLKLIGSQSARDYLAAVQLAVEEPDSMTLTVPPYLKGKTIWIPSGKGKVTGAKVLKLAEGWAQIEAGSEPIVVTARRQ